MHNYSRRRWRVWGLNSCCRERRDRDRQRYIHLLLPERTCLLDFGNSASQIACQDLQSICHENAPDFAGSIHRGVERLRQVRRSVGILCSILNSERFQTSRRRAAEVGGVCRIIRIGLRAARCARQRGAIQIRQRMCHAGHPRQEALLCCI